MNQRTAAVASAHSDCTGKTPTRPAKMAWIAVPSTVGMAMVSPFEMMVTRPPQKNSVASVAIIEGMPSWVTISPLIRPRPALSTSVTAIATKVRSWNLNSAEKT